MKNPPRVEDRTFPLRTATMGFISRAVPKPRLTSRPKKDFTKYKKRRKQ
jgi:hypothetical protein